MKQMLNASGTFLGAIRQQLFDSWQPPKKEIQKSREGHETILTSALLNGPTRNNPEFLALVAWSHMDALKLEMKTWL